MKRIIAQVIQPTKVDSRQGFIAPLYIYNDIYSHWQKLDNPSLEFPNKGNIFVFKNYDLLANDYERYFFIDVDEADNYKPEETQSARYKASQDNAINPEENEICEVLEKDNFNPANLSFQYTEKNKPDTHHLFIKNQNIVYGPFTRDAHYNKDADDYTITLRGLLENAYCIYAFLDEHIEVEKLYLDDATYIDDSVKLIRNYKKQINGIFYFGEIKELLEWGKRRFDIEEPSWKAINNVVKKLETFKIDDTLEQYKLSALLRILNSSIDWFNNKLPQFIFRYLEETEKGAEFLTSYMNANSSLIQDTYNAELQKINSEIDQRKEELSKLDAGSILFGDLSEGQHGFIKKVLANKALLERFSQYANIEEQYYTIKARKDIEQEQLEVLKKDLQKLNEEDRKLKASFYELRNELSRDDVVSSQLLKIKTYTEILNGISWLSDEAEGTESKLINAPAIKKGPVNIREYIIEIQNNLKSVNREISFNDLANYLITINQNFFTVFAGLPGVGKTSLITQLAQASGLDKLFTSISVARGWTSGKDLIGYYNPISQRFQSSNTGLYDTLIMHEQHGEYPYWVLLDEANLSPIEHYWSDFMKFSDPESEKILSIRETVARNKNYNLKDNFRFIATINYDHTTEVLSPRLIDRAAIILLDAPDYSDALYTSVEHKTDSLKEVLGVELIRENFYVKQPDLLKDEKSLLETILNTLKDDSEEYGMPVIVSPRKIKALYHYCSVANNVLDRSGNQFTAFDYAISQHILPLIDGRGEAYYKRLEKLRTEINQLPITSRRLQRIIQYGKSNYDNYRFFI